MARGSASVDGFRVAADANARGNSTSSASALRVSTPNRLRRTLKRTPTARSVEPLTVYYGWPRGRFNSAPSFESLFIKRKVRNTGHATPTGRTADEKSYDRNCDTESSPIALSYTAKACVSAVMHPAPISNPLSVREVRLLVSVKSADCPRARRSAEPHSQTTPSLSRSSMYSYAGWPRWTGAIL